MSLPAPPAAQANGAGLRAWIPFVMIALAMLRIWALVAHEPLAGYGNQYDMYRTESCVGIFPRGEAARREEPTPSAPIATYAKAEAGDDCYGSTEVALLAAVSAASGFLGANPESFQLRWMGYAKLALLAGVAFLLAFALRAHGVAAFVHAAVVLFVLADPAVTLWFNTLYTEFWVGWGLYASIGAICALVLRAGLPATMGALACAGSVALALSKEQFAMLPMGLAIVALPWLCQRSRAWSAAILAVSLVGCLVGMYAMPRHGDIPKMNRSHVYLGLVVPAFESPAAGLRALGLPQRCLTVAGSEWFQRRGSSIEHACAEVYGLSSIAFLKLAASDPAALGRSVARALPATQQAVIPYLGVLEGASYASPEDLGLAGLSLVAWADRSVPLGAYMTAILCVALAGLAAIVLATRSAMARAPLGPALLFTALIGAVTAFCLVTTVFGDGLTEAGRHFWAGQIAALAGAVAFVAAAPALMNVAMRGGARSIAIAIAAAATLAAALLCVSWMRNQPEAIGIVDDSSCVASTPELRVSGWALSPSGVADVEVQVGAKRFAATYGADATERLHRIFPGYPDSAHGGFMVAIPREAVPGASGVSVRVLVRDRGGSVSTVDHCTIP